MIGDKYQVFGLYSSSGTVHVSVLHVLTLIMREAWGPLPPDEVKQDERKKRHYEEHLVYPLQDLGSQGKPPEEDPQDAELDECTKDETEANNSIREDKIITSLPLRSTFIQKDNEKNDTKAD